MKKMRTEYIAAFAFMVVALVIASIFIGFSMTAQNGTQHLSEGVVPEIRVMRINHDEALPGATVSIMTTIYNMGTEDGDITCVWTNQDTGERLGSKTSFFPAMRGMTQICDVTVPENATGTFIVRADVNHTVGVIDDTETATVVVTNVAHRVFITVVDTNTSEPIGNARVQLSAQVKMTDASGNAEFVIAPGSYWLGVMHEHYLNWETPADGLIEVSASDLEYTVRLTYAGLYPWEQNETQNQTQEQAGVFDFIQQNIVFVGIGIALIAVGVSAAVIILRKR